jgi:hypothetical protein
VPFDRLKRIAQRINLPAVMLRSKEVSLDCTSRLHRLSLHLVTISSILLKRLNAVGVFRGALYFVLIRLLGLGGLFDRKTPVNQLEGSATAQFSLSPG